MSIGSSRAPILRPADLRHTVVDGRRVAYVEAGDGNRVCILIHGMGGCWRHWYDAIPALMRTHRVIALDLPGFGDSEVPPRQTPAHAVAVIDALRELAGVADVDVIGHSMGTLIACEVAARLPRTVARMILVGGPISTVIDLFHAPLATLRRDPRVAAFLVEALTAGIRPPKWLVDLVVSSPRVRRLALSTYVHRAGDLSAEAVRHLLAGAGGPGTLATLRQGFGYDCRPALDAVGCPTLLVGGAHDKIAPQADLHAFAARDRANRRVAILPDSGHLPMLEQPTEFNRIIREFLTAADESK